jgi:hypothetical protein
MPELGLQANLRQEEMREFFRLLHHHAELPPQPDFTGGYPWRA